MIGKMGTKGATQKDYLLASLQLASRASAQVLTLETVRDKSDHRPLLLDVLTHVQRRVNKRQWIPPSKPKNLGWRLDAEISAKNSHTIADYSDHILEQLDLGENSGKFKEDWRRKLEDFDENSTFFFTDGSSKLYRKKSTFSSWGFCVSSKHSGDTDSILHTACGPVVLKKKSRFCHWGPNILAPASEEHQV